MAFTSKRLRVQLPCEEAKSLVEAPEVAQAPGQLCAGGGFFTLHCLDFITPPRCPTAISPIPPIGCHGFLSPGPEPGCTPLSPVFVDPRTPVIRERETVLLHPDHLPHFRRQLEAELEQIEALQERKADVEGQLKELDSIEEELEKQAEEQ